MHRRAAHFGRKPEVSRTKHHRDAISPRRYLLKDWPPRHRVLRAIWNLRDAFVDLVTQ